MRYTAMLVASSLVFAGSASCDELQEGQAYACVIEDPTYQPFGSSMVGNLSSAPKTITAATLSSHTSSKCLWISTVIERPAFTWATRAVVRITCIHLEGLGEEKSKLTDTDCTSRKAPRSDRPMVRG